MLILWHSTAFAVSIHRKIDWRAHFGNRVFHIVIHAHLLGLIRSCLVLHIFDLLKLISQFILILLYLVFHIQNMFVIIGFDEFILA